MLSLVNKHKDKLPEGMNSVEEIKEKAEDLIAQHGNRLDQVTDKISSDTDDKKVDQAREALKK
jgi:hypothetical protein